MLADLIVHHSAQGARMVASKSNDTTHLSRAVSEHVAVANVLLLLKVGLQTLGREQRQQVSRESQGYVHDRRGRLRGSESTLSTEGEHKHSKLPHA